MSSLPFREHHHHRSRWRFGDLGDENFHVSSPCILVVTLVSSALILLLILILYIRWVLRYRHVSLTAAQRGAIPSCHGLSKEAIAAIPVIAGEEEAHCSICLSTLEMGEKVKVLPLCKHVFHPDCVDVWLGSRNTCPLCRDSLHFYSIDGKHEEEEPSPV